MVNGPFHVIALVLVVAGVAKLRRPEPTMSALASSKIPVQLLGASELGFGALALLFGADPIGWVILAYYAGFAAWTASRIAQPCGCFGSEASVSVSHVVANVVSAFIALAAGLTHVTGLPAVLAADWAAAGSLLATVVIGAAAVILILQRPPTTTVPTSFRMHTAAEVELRPGFMERVTARTTRFAQTAVSRRAFLGRAALVGTALAVNPGRFILTPGTAYAAICDCQGTQCECGSLCCDGYTEFCCTLYGANSCPPGSIAAGWWKADGSGFCDVDGVPQPRYYIDCNAECSGCACTNGFCDPACVFCDCQCAGGECTNRKACCTKFRYGQCNQDATCIGPIVCRVITCVPPWVWDPTCGTTSATDNNTAFHDAACLHVGGAPTDLSRAVPGGVPILGDWNADGRKTPGVFRDGVWYLSNTLEGGEADIVFIHGQRGDIPVVGDWNGDGRDTIGFFRAGLWHLRNDNAEGPDDVAFAFGDAGDIPVVGDWTGNGPSLPGIVRRGIWHLRYSLTSGVSEHSFAFGLPTDYPFAADFNGDGFASPGVFRAGRWFLRNRNDFGNPDLEFEYGLPGDIPLIGGWNQSGQTLPIIVRGGEWHLRDSLNTGPGTRVLTYGTRSNAPAVVPR